MGFARKRAGRDGKPRYTAYYLDIRGQERSVGRHLRYQEGCQRRLETGRGRRQGREAG